MKKIPAELRRSKTYLRTGSWFHRVTLRLRDDSQTQRSVVQAAFVLLCIWIGIEFHYFVKWGLSDGASAYVERPPGVEGFLPISALISFKYWLETSIVNEIHPSAFFILIGIVAMSFLARKSFCSWFCPVGTLSEALWMVGEKLFKRNITPPRWLDYPLRSLKYLLLAFFVWAISQMSLSDLASFIESPYNRVADIKMYLFFAEISSAAIWTIGILMAGSVLIKNFWCRFLCPYGALLGIVGWLSPLKIRRESSSCIDCELCTKVCPSRIKVHTVKTVMSDECTSCLKCVEICPVKETLLLKAPVMKRSVPSIVLAMLLCGVFAGTIGLGMLSGHWKNKIPKEEYLMRFQELNTSKYAHFQGTAMGK
jgi:ferredoxin